jgi:AAA family ATP:ADP antiporter
VLGLHPGEGAFAWKFFFAFLILTAVHFAAKSVRQATYIDSVGSENLPWVYLALAVVSLPTLLLYSRLAARFNMAALMLVGTLLHVLGLVAFFVLFGLDQAWVAVAYYIWLGMVFAIAVSQFWSFANQVYDPRQARRLFSFIGAGGLLGSVLGGLMAIAVTGAVARATPCWWLRVCCCCCRRSFSGSSARGTSIGGSVSTSWRPATSRRAGVCGCWAVHAFSV